MQFSCLTYRAQEGKLGEIIGPIHERANGTAEVGFLRLSVILPAETLKEPRKSVRRAAEKSVPTSRDR